MLRAAVAILACLAAGAALADAELKPWKGGATPPLDLARLDGSRLDLASLKGRVVVVNFWATWCEPCIAEMPSLERLRERLKGSAVEIITVNFGESSEKASAFVAKQQLTLPVLLDPDKKAAGDWKVGGLPMTFLVDARGKVRWWTFGERDWSDASSVQRVQRLVQETRRAGP